MLENEPETDEIWKPRSPKLSSNSNGSDKRGRIRPGSESSFLKGAKLTCKMTVSEKMLVTDDVGEAPSNIKLTALSFSPPTNRAAGYRGMQITSKAAHMFTAAFCRTQSVMR